MNGAIGGMDSRYVDRGPGVGIANSLTATMPSAECVSCPHLVLR